MAKALLIAEKPSLMRDAKAAYEKYGFPDQIDFTSFVGHTMTLFSPEDYHKEWKDWKLESLPLIPEQFKYKPTEDKKKLYFEIKQQIEMGDYDYLINCCDPGREGQHIFHNFYETIGCQLPVKRMWHNDVTLSGMKKAFDNLRDDLNEPALVNMTEASKLRAYFDWLIGMNFSRAFTLVGNKKVAIGRVMTPTLKLVVDRELELKDFKKEKYWELTGNFGTYEGTLQLESGETRFFDVSKANELVSLLKGRSGVVKEVESERQVKYAPKLYALSDIQGDANEAYGYTMEETLKIIQTLYEGKILSYPRTDSTYITEAVADEFPKMLTAISQIPSVKPFVDQILADSGHIRAMSRNKTYVDNTKVSDHYAIVPTGVTFDFNKLNKSQKNILELVAKRLVAIFLPPIITDKSVLFTEVDGYLFKTNGSLLVDPGYSVVYGKSFKDKVIPLLNKGDQVTLEDLVSTQKETKPPKRYTEKTLGNALKYAGRLVENEEMKKALNNREGIGTPATRGAIVEKLVQSKMIERVKNNLHATPYGIAIIQHLNGHAVTSPELTGKWEGKLLKIEACDLQPQQFYQEMLTYIQEETEKLKQMKFSMGDTSSTLKSIGTCPACQNQQVVVGKDFYICRGYKNTCMFAFPKSYYGANVTETDMKQIMDGKESKEKTFTFVKEGKKMSSKGKLYFNKADKRIRIAFPKASESQVVGVCPKCKKSVLSGTFYRCEGYHQKTCDFSLSNQICGAEIDQEDIGLMLQGKESKVKLFTYRSGKKGHATLSFKPNGELEFHFIKK